MYHFSVHSFFFILRKKKTRIMISHVRPSAIPKGIACDTVCSIVYHPTELCFLLRNRDCDLVHMLLDLHFTDLYIQ